MEEDTHHTPKSVGAGLSILGLFGAGFGATSGALTGTVGAFILQQAGYAEYDTKEAAQIGALGGAVFNSFSSVLVGCLGVCNLANNFKGFPNIDRWDNILSTSLVYATDIMLQGIVGYGLRTAAGSDTEMDTAHVSAAFAVGAALTTLPAVYCLVKHTIPAFNSALEKFLSIDEAPPERRTRPPEVPKIEITPPEEQSMDADFNDRWHMGGAGQEGLSAEIRTPSESAEDDHRGRWHLTTEGASTATATATEAEGEYTGGPSMV